MAAFWTGVIELFTANSELKVNQIQQLPALALCTQATKEASLAA
jgi:hypothetical protein